MKLDCLEHRDVEKVRKWRNEILETLRTPFLLTTEMQKEFYENVICCRKNNHRHRFWAVRGNLKELPITGMAGLINISLENRNAEISILISPDQRGKGCGSKTIFLLLEKGFDELNLENIYGEAYKTNSKNIDFWNKQIKKYNAYSCVLPNRKYWDGKYHDSLYFNINKKNYKKIV